MRSGDDIAQSVIPVPGLRPEVHSANGQLLRSSNLQDKLGEVAEAMRTRPWLAKLVREVNAGKKTAVVTTSLGALVVTTAVGTGLELGIRHGKDLRELVKLVRKWRRQRKRRR